MLLPKDWLRLKLTGESFSDMSDASSSLWLDVGERRWSGELLQACGLDINHMPGLVEGSAISAPLRDSVARARGLPPGIGVTGGSGDNAASAFGWVTALAGRPNEAALAGEAAKLNPAEREQAPYFLPCRAGERTPHNNAAATGVFTGLRHGHQRPIWATPSCKGLPSA